MHALWLLQALSDGHDSPCPVAYAKDWRLSPCNGAGSDHSAARKAARDARKLRAEALAAHVAAAVAIERANNQDRGLDDWTLDLHGLHVAEATAALSRRSVIFKEELLWCGSPERLHVR